MNLFGIMQISGSALRAERVRAEIVATNMANAETTRTEDGTPYRRQSVLLQPSGNNFHDVFRSVAETPIAGGVEVAGIAQSEVPAQRRYDPSHPDADASGFVSYPDINPVTEMVDLMGASRSYSMNATALQAEKGMLMASLDLLK